MDAELPWAELSLGYSWGQGSSDMASLMPARLSHSTETQASNASTQREREGRREGGRKGNMETEESKVALKQTLNIALQKSILDMTAKF